MDRGLAKAAADAKAIADAKAVAGAEAKAVADKNAKINAEAKRVADALEQQTRELAAKAAEKRAIEVQEKRDGLLSSEIATNEDIAEVEEAPVAIPAEAESTSKGLIDSFLPDVISESLKGEGNYSPEWVEKNKVAGAKHLEELYASGQLQLPKSNFTDSSGNAIGGVSNSQDNTAMQNMAANGVEDPLSALSKEVSDQSGLDTSFSGAFDQAINGADGHEFEGGSGLLNYANSQQEDTAMDNREKVFLESEAKPEAEGELVNGIPVDDLSSKSAADFIKFSDNLGFESMQAAQSYWDSMSPEAQAIFNSKENPQLSDKILAGVFGSLIPGFGLLNRFMYNDKMTLEEKLEYANKTAGTIAKNNDSSQGGNQGVADNNGGGSTGGTDSGDSPAPVADEDKNAVQYSNLDSYLTLFNNFKF